MTRPLPAITCVMRNESLEGEEAPFSYRRRGRVYVHGVK